MREQRTGSTRTRSLAVAIALSAALVAAVFRVWMERVPLTRHVQAKNHRDEEHGG